MTVYARSDVMCVTVSKSHGGCGAPHGRPVVQGAPARTWKLDCQQCQAHLSKDPLWSLTLADVPSSPDESTARDNAEKQTARSREDIMALALAKIAGLPVAEFLGGMIGQAADDGVITCAAGHDNFPSAKFCAECGGRLSPMVTRGLMEVPRQRDDLVPLSASAPPAVKAPVVRKPRAPRQPSAVKP